MGKFRIHGLVGILVCVLGLPSCSSKSSLTITLTPDTTQTINQGETLNITATVANDSTSGGVTWSLSGVGSLSGATNTSVTYVAPNVLSTSTSATITATSVAKTTVTATLTIDVSAVLTITSTSLPIATLGQPYIGVISADGGTAPFAWTLTGDLPPGLALSSSTSSSITISGTPTALGAYPFSIGVTDSADGSASKDLSITVNPKPPLSVATKSLPAGTVGTPYSSTLHAANGTAPYSWSIIAGALPAGLSLTANSGVISGTPTTAEAPQFTVQVTDSSSPQQTATGDLSILINSNVSDNARLNGDYAFLVSGFDDTTPFVAAGSFVADGNGNITNGTIDTNEPGNLQANLSFTGSYSVDPGGLGTMGLSMSGGGTRSFAFALTANNNAKIIEFDDLAGDGTRDSGVLLKQDSNAFSASAITGNYAFGLLGADAAGARYGLAGALHADGAGTFSNGVLDSDDAGVTANVAFSGTYSVPFNPPSSRGTMTISIAGQGKTNYSFYIVSATQLLVMEIDQVNAAASPLVSGNMLQQTGSHDTLNGTSVFETNALDTSSGTVSDGQVGLFTTAGAGNLTVNWDENSGGTPTTHTSLPGATYTVDAAGRATLNYSVLVNGNPVPISTVAYLVNSNEGFLVGTDPAVTFGFMKNQPGPGQFTAASLSGTYAGGSVAPIVSAGNNQIDIAISNGVDTLQFTTDSSNTTGLSQGQTSSWTYTMAATGRAQATKAGADAVIYMVSPTEYFQLSGGQDPNAMVEAFQQ
ncbi:MAG: Ig domain-containing protein [Acidobacteriia bacterium]|nr:Ig domain-containing protein [Terriglobia bacterium]